MAVSDAELARAVEDSATRDGLLLCPEGGATLAAWRRAKAEGWVKEGETALLFNCATGLKYPLPDKSRTLDRHQPIDWVQTLQQAYQDRVYEVLRPKMLADAKAELVKHGIFEGFPERSQYASDKLFAEALERHCGLQPGSYFVESQWGLIAQPKAERQSKAEEAKMSCLGAAIMYASARGDDFKFGFIGNEAFAPEQ